MGQLSIGIFKVKYKSFLAKWNYFTSRHSTEAGLKYQAQILK